MSKPLYVLFLTLFIVVAGCTPNKLKPVVKDRIDTVQSELDAYEADRKKRENLKKTIENIKRANQHSGPLKDNTRFDIKTDNVEAEAFFMNLMAGTEKNIVIHPGVEGKISLHLTQVSLDEVLNVVRDVYGLDYKYKNAIYTIFPRQLRTEIFPINYLNVKRVGVSDTTVLTGNVQSSSQSDSASSAASLSGEGTSIQPGSRIQTRSETDFWLTLNRSLSQLVGVNPDSGQSGTATLQRKVITNPQTGVAIVTAMPSELASVRRFLDQARLSVKRQVIIEAKIIEIQLNESNKTGINWNAINGQLLLGKNVGSLTGDIDPADISEDIGEVFSSLVRISDITTLLSLLKTQGEMQVLSSPRVSTVNNQKAVIRVGSDQFFVTGVSSSTISNASSTTSSPDIELSSFFSGISLDVTPQIADDDGVILHIHPVISTVTEEQKNIVVGDAAFSLPLALRDIRESDSIVKAQSGQVIVLGGLMQERFNQLRGKRPGLSHIPVAGELFKTRSTSRVKSELIILLKPIVVDQDSWVDDFKKSHDRFDKLSNKPYGG